MPTMAYVVPRRSGGWELRESRATPAGPRARTLASFKTLDGETIDHAIRRASRPLPAEAIRRAATRAGAPIAWDLPDAAGAELLRRLLRHREQPAPAVKRLLLAALGGSVEITDAERQAAEWIGATTTERGETLVDLLSLADALPSRRSGELTFPRLVSVGERA